MKWYHGLIMWGIVLAYAIAINFLPVNVSLSIMFSALFIMMFSDMWRNLDQFGDIKMRLIPIEVHTEVGFKHLNNKITLLAQEINSLKHMVHLQQIVDRQQVKTEETKE